MTEYVTGQNYGWNGGECPVHPKTKIKIWTRDGITCGKVVWDAENCLWVHGRGDPDIVCFQVVTPYVEPKTIWVNEYADGGYAAHTSEAEAKLRGAEWHTSIAVKYVEAKE